MIEATEAQKAACRSIGTKQCAAICLSHLPSFAPGECPEAHRIWTERAIKAERKRRPDGPLGGDASPKAELRDMLCASLETTP
jgi:hypothetical protein